jgi:hypothetical protein
LFRLAQVNPALNTDEDLLASNVEAINALTVIFWDQIFKSVSEFPVYVEEGGFALRIACCISFSFAWGGSS